MTATVGIADEAELLGCIIAGADLAALDVEPEHFWEPRHERIFLACLAIAAEGRRCDPQSVFVEMGAAEAAKLPDGPLHLYNLARDASTINAPKLAERVRDAHRRRIAREHLTRGMMLLDDGAPLSELAGVLAPAIDQTARTAVSKIGEPIDWRARWNATKPEEKWLLEPLIGRGRLVSIYSPPKAGKSLLMLEIAAAIATGIDVLGQPVRQGPVVYVDFENDPDDDIIPRLQDLGYAAHQLDALIYHSFPTIDALDSPNGGRELLQLAQRHDAALVVIDTVSRTVAGEENANDTWLSFYKHTALLLKREGIACVRLDHSGKDPTKGQRGGSAKGGDVDAIWKLTAIGDDTVHLECEATRQRIADEDKVMVLSRRTYPLRHVLESKPGQTTFESRVKDLLAKLDGYQIDPGAGRDKVRAVLREHGVTARNDVLGEALKRRKGQPVPDPKTCPKQAGTGAPDTLVPDDLGQAGTGDAA